MSLHSPRPLGIIIAGGIILLSGVLFVGILSEDPTDSPDPEELVADAAAGLASEPIEGIRTDTVENRLGTVQTTVEIAESPPDRLRIEQHELKDTRENHSSSNHESADIQIHNGSERWAYYEERGEANRSTVDGHWVSDTTRFGIVDRQQLDQYEFSYQGTETVAGRQTQVVEIEPSTSVSAEFSVEVGAGQYKQSISIGQIDDEEWQVAEETWWIDATEEYPIKQQLRLLDEDGNEVTTKARTYEELNVGAELDPQKFAFDPPSGTEVVEQEPGPRETFDEISTAIEESGLERDEISAPDGWELRFIRTFGLDDPDLLLEYTNEDGQQVSVTVMPDSPDAFASAATYREEKRYVFIEEDVGDVGGVLFSNSGRPNLRWTCGNEGYWISTDQDANALVKFANHIQCR